MMTRNDFKVGDIVKYTEQAKKQSWYKDSSLHLKNNEFIIKKVFPQEYPFCTSHVNIREHIDFQTSCNWIELVEKQEWDNKAN